MSNSTLSTLMSQFVRKNTFLNSVSYFKILWAKYNCLNKTHNAKKVDFDPTTSCLIASRAVTAPLIYIFILGTTVFFRRYYLTIFFGKLGKLLFMRAHFYYSIFEVFYHIWYCVSNLSFFFLVKMLTKYWSTIGRF